MKSFFSHLIFENPWDDGTPNTRKDQPPKKETKGSIDFEALLQQELQKWKNLFSKKSGGQDGNEAPKPLKVLSIIIAVLSIIWLATGFYTVDTDEEGVVMRFGKYNRTSTPGLNYKLPAPIENVQKISVTRINKEVIGLKTHTTIKPQELNDDTDSSIPKESQMLTGDENIIEMHFFVQWYVKSAKDYLFNIKDDVGESTIKVCAESAMRQVVGLVKISEALSEQRQEIEQRVKTMLQDLLNGYHSGIEIVNVGILYSYVAPEVRDAYRDIQSAKADKEKEINEALAYKNDIIPRARGEAQSIIEESKGYKEAVIFQASGESERFKSVYDQYQSSREITKKRLYIEAMEGILKDINKVIVDKSVSHRSVPLLSINELIKKD